MTIDLGTFSSFLALVIGFGAVGSFFDFYLGKNGQKKFKDKLEDWWLRAAEVRFDNFGANEATFLINSFDLIFGTLFSYKRLFWSLIILLGGQISVHFSVGDFGWDMPIFFYLAPVADVLMFNVSISVSRYAAWIMRSRLGIGIFRNFVYVTAILLFYIIFCYHYYLLTMCIKIVIRQTIIIVAYTGNYSEILSSIYWTIYYGLDEILASDRINLYELYFVGFFYLPWGDVLQNSLKYSIITILFVNIMRIGIFILYSLLLLIRPMSGAIMTLWARLIEVERPGPFTLIFGGVAVAAKIVQEIVRWLSF